MRPHRAGFMARSVLSLLGLALLSSCAGARQAPPPEEDLVAAIRKLPPELRLPLAEDAFLQALWLDLQGQDMLSLDFLQEAAWHDPDDRWLQFALASRLREFRRSPEALALAKRAIALPGEETADQWGLLAGLWLEAGARDSARACWERMLALDPRAREALVGLATLAESRGDLVEAARRYAALSEDYGDAARAIVARSVALWMKAGRSDSASALLARRWAAWRDPDEGEALARLLSSRGLPDSASILYDSLAALPDAESSRLRLMAARAWMLNDRLDSARRRLVPLALQGFVEARASLGALLLDLDSLDASRSLFLELVDDAEHGALACHYLGVIASRQADRDSARDWFDRALEKDPQRPDTWARRGLLELDDDSPDSARVVFERMTRLWPSSAQARWLLGHALSRLAEKRSTLPVWDVPGPGKDSGGTPFRIAAIAQFDTTLQLAPDYKAARFERAAAMERLGRRDSAFAEFRRIVRDAPDDPVAANYLAYMLAEDGIDIPYADSLVGRAIATDTLNPAYLDTRAWIRHRQGRDAEALADVDRAIAQGEDDPVVLEHRAVLLQRLGRADDAREAWETLLAKCPDHPRALRALGRTR